MKKNNVEEKEVVTTSLSEESIDYLNRLKKEEITYTFGMKTVETWYNDLLNGNIVVNNKYQRKAYAWSRYLNQLFLFTLFEHGIVPPLVLADLSFIDKTKKYFEILDGQQRATLMKLWMENKIRLPRYLSEELGGGKTRDECPSETKERIDKYVVWYIHTIPKTEDQIYNIYNRIQKGKQLTFGQDIRGHQGKFKELITELSTHPFINYVRKGSEDWELQTAGYLYLDLIHDDGINKLTNFERESLTQYLEEHSEDEITKFVYDACINRADKIQKLCEMQDIRKLRNVQLIAVSRCLNKLFSDYSEAYLNELGEALSVYYSKIEECLMFIKLDKKPETSFDENYSNKIKLSPYYALTLQQLRMLGGLAEKHTSLLWEEFEKVMEEKRSD